MSSPYESATLIVRLYEMRREATMRLARNWYARSFNPSSIDEVMQTISGPSSGDFRMVISYWDMACSFVLNGAIDEKMFLDANGEQNVVFAKIEPFIADYRAAMGPTAMQSLEALVMKQPDASSRMSMLRERFRDMAAR